MSTVNRQYTLDPATLQRFEDIERTLRERLRLTPAETRPSVIVRRAIEAYAVHLEDLCSNEQKFSGADATDEYTLTVEMRQRFEAGNLRRNLQPQGTREEKQRAVDEAKQSLRRFLK